MKVFRKSMPPAAAVKFSCPPGNEIAILRSYGTPRIVNWVVTVRGIFPGLFSTTVPFRLHQ